MVTDSRGHQVPAGSDSWGYREDMEALSASITDVRSVADQAAATAAVADLDAADLDTEGTVWWLQSPGTLVVYTSGEFVPLPTQAALDDATKATSDALARLPYAITNAATTMPSTKPDSSSSKTVTFPAGLFPGPPAVVVSPETTAPKTRQLAPSSITATSFVLTLVNDGGVALTGLAANWIASRQGSPAVVAAASPAADATVTCPTDGCGNQGVTIPVVTTCTDDDGTTHPVDAVECGVCGTDITGTVREAS